MTDRRGCVLNNVRNFAATIIGPMRRSCGGFPIAKLGSLQVRVTGRVSHAGNFYRHAFACTGVCCRICLQFDTKDRNLWTSIAAMGECGIWHSIVPVPGTDDVVEVSFVVAPIASYCGDYYAHADIRR